MIGRSTFSSDFVESNSASAPQRGHTGVSLVDSSSIRTKAEVASAPRTRTFGIPKMSSSIFAASRSIAATSLAHGPTLRC